MPGRIRPPEERAALEHDAIALRREDWTMAAISRELGVPVSTLNQWAAQNGWRQRDLEKEAAEARLDEIQARADERAEALDTGGEDADSPAIAESPGSAPSAADAAQALLNQAARAAVGGHVDKADKLARLAQRFLDLRSAADALAVERAEADYEAGQAAKEAVMQRHEDNRLPPGMSIETAMATLPDEDLPDCLVRLKLCQDLLAAAVARGEVEETDDVRAIITEAPNWFEMIQHRAVLEAESYPPTREEIARTLATSERRADCDGPGPWD